MAPTRVLGGHHTRVPFSTEGARDRRRDMVMRNFGAARGSKEQGLEVHAVRAVSLQNSTTTSDRANEEITIMRENCQSLREGRGESKLTTHQDRVEPVLKRAPELWTIMLRRCAPQQCCARPRHCLRWSALVGPVLQRAPELLCCGVARYCSDALGRDIVFAGQNSS